MASPPFNIAETLPGDSDIVSQHPFNARAFRDTVESWLLINHDTNGAHKFVDTPWAASPAAPAASINRIFATATGALKMIINGGTEMFVGVPPGTVAHTASSVVPNGWLLADFSAVSRSTFADLFAAIGTTHGAGDGSTTFNIPPASGRVIAGTDEGTARLTAAGLGVAANLGAVGGEETHLLTANQIPSITSNGANAISVSTAGTYPTGTVIVSDPGTGGGASRYAAGTLAIITATNPSQAIAVTSNNTGGAVHVNVQPTLVLRTIIKY